MAGVLAVLAAARKAVATLDDSIAQDWTVFTSCLDLINTAGVVLQAVEECDECLERAFSAAEICWSLQPFKLSAPALLPLAEVATTKNYLQQIIESGGVLSDSLTKAREECRSCVTVGLQTISAPLQTHLKPVPSLPLWTSKLPHTLSSAFSPQEYVTQMGQYLLTLPQHLEPLLVSPSPALNRALQQVAPDHSKHAGQRAVSESEVSAADFLIGRVAQKTCQMFADAVLRIPMLEQHAHSQLITDIEYICNILA
ncbi:hypothetical protein HAZT_HAZT005702 [Hyalella azteca]|uniref:Conserved oligomeric Golgi complex subunit 7 n=1 Tax=Hyalella azteca TaxID=294128 RepID=A0A6A0HBC4_HYAAZ|nr:hypothetical protein HAZT_HAZT005702 [Hyalella azteca]